MHHLAQLSLLLSSRIHAAAIILIETTELFSIPLSTCFLYSGV